MAKSKFKIIFLIILSLVVISVAAVVLFNAVIIPNSKYNDALMLMEEKKYEDAVSAFEALGDFRDSKSKINETKYNKALDLMKEGEYSAAVYAFEDLGDYEDAKAKLEFLHDEMMENAEVGKSVFFGTYEQDDNADDGEEKIEWLVLAKENDKMLLISKYALLSRAYNDSGADATWESCSLRKWLNDDFINGAFNVEERLKISETLVTAEKNVKYGTDSGNSTKDKIFLLCIEEAERYFSSDYARQCEPTKYASGDIYTDTMGICWWWLRTSGQFNNKAAKVDTFGSVSESGEFVDYFAVGVRPVLWITIE